MSRKPTIAKILVAAAAIACLFQARAAEPPAAQPAVSDAERTYRDFDFAPAAPEAGAAALRMRLAAPLPRDKVRAVTIHLKSGDGWHSADLGGEADAFCAGQSVRTPLAAFSPEGSPDPIAKASVIRVSAWKRADFDDPIILAEAAFDAPARVAVVRSTERTAQGDAAFAGLLADRCAKLLEKAGLQYDFVSDDCAALLVKNGAKPSRAYDLALLPFSPHLSADELGRLKAFVKAGGKLVVFFNADRTLGALLGVEPGPWRSTGTRAYTAIDAAPLFGARRRIPHFTEGVIPPRPAAGGEARKVATWISAFNRPAASPAVTLSPAGAWFAHIPPRAYPAATDLISAIATNLVPSLASAAGSRKPAAGSRKLEDCLAGRPCAAWVNTAELPVDDFAELKALGIDTLFMHWQTAHEHKRPFPAAGKPDTPEAQLAAARAAGLALHAWITCFTLDGVSDEERARFKREGRLSKANPGWLDPALPKNRDLVVGQLAEMAKRGVSGIHIDYARTDDATPPSPETTAAITDFVRKASQAVKAADTNIVFSAAVFPTPDAAARRNQDWPAWVKEGLVDFVCPMIYTESPAEFQSELDACLKAAPAEKLMPGIGTGADESQTDAPTTSAELAAAVGAGCRGIAFFTLNDSLVEILEALR